MGYLFLDNSYQKITALSFSLFIMQLSSEFEVKWAKLKENRGHRLNNG